MAVHHRHNKVKLSSVSEMIINSAVLVTYHIQFHLITAHDLTALCNVKRCKSRYPQEIKYSLLSFLLQLIFLILTHCKMLWFFLFSQFLKQHIYCIFKCLIIFPCFRSVDKLQKPGRKVLFFLSDCFILDIADQGTVRSSLLSSRNLTGLLAYPFRVHHDRDVTSFKISFPNGYSEGL